MPSSHMNTSLSPYGCTTDYSDKLSGKELEDGSKTWTLFPCGDPDGAPGF